MIKHWKTHIQQKHLWSNSSILDFWFWIHHNSIVLMAAWGIFSSMNKQKPMSLPQCPQTFNTKFKDTRLFTGFVCLKDRLKTITILSLRKNKICQCLTGQQPKQPLNLLLGMPRTICTSHPHTRFYLEK